MQKTPESNSKMSSQEDNPYKRRLKSSPKECYNSAERKISEYFMVIC
jgi:hypothetical protein